MVEIRLTYEGDLHCSAVHQPSGSVIATDAPLDNNGRGEAFSPTDLVATALAACMATVIGIVAKRKEIDRMASAFEHEAHQQALALG
jgi:putative redox protein